MTQKRDSDSRREYIAVTEGEGKAGFGIAQVGHYR